jgi:hypothetical protein
MLQGDTISTSMTLLQSAEPSIRLWTTRRLLSIFCDYSQLTEFEWPISANAPAGDLRFALLKEDGISTLVRMMQSETEYLVIRYAVSTLLKNFMKYGKQNLSLRHPLPDF